MLLRDLMESLADEEFRDAILIQDFRPPWRLNKKKMCKFCIFLNFLNTILKLFIKMFLMLAALK